MDTRPYKETVQSFVERGNYHAAINIAISAMNECRKNTDQPGVDACLTVIREVVDDMVREFGSEAFVSRLLE